MKYPNSGLGAFLDIVRNSDLVVKKVCSSLRQNVGSKFRNAEKLIPFVFEGASTSLKMRKTSQLAFS